MHRSKINQTLMTEPEARKVICPHCGGENPLSAVECAHCNGEIIFRIDPAPKLATRITLGSIMLLVAILAVYFAAFSADISFGMFLVIVSVPALVRTLYVVEKRRRKEIATDATGILLRFIIALAILFASLFCGLAALFASCMLMMPVAQFGDPNRLLVVLVVLCFGVGLFTLVYTLIVFWRKVE